MKNQTTLENGGSPYSGQGLRSMFIGLQGFELISAATILAKNGIRLINEIIARLIGFLLIRILNLTTRKVIFLILLSYYSFLRS